MAAPHGRQQQIAHAVATVAGLGDRLPAPGTLAGSLPAALGFWLAVAVVPEDRLRNAGLVIAVALAAIVGMWAAGVEARRRGAHDPGAVVIDEVAGQWLALVVAWLVLRPATPTGLAILVAAGFVLFRFLDVVKPWPIRKLEHLPGGLGIVADDLAAGLLAGLLVAGAGRLLGP
jgi:phosphatidylglycerophosphatase A